jgi:hypothetical protein
MLSPMHSLAAGTSYERHPSIQLNGFFETDLESSNRATDAASRLNLAREEIELPEEPG